MHLDTEIKTVDRGWQTMATIRVGDRVFGSDGKPTNVVAKTEPFMPEAMYRLTLNTGEVFDVDGGHLWLTLTDDERMKNLRRDPAWREKRKAGRKSRAVAEPKRPNQGKAAARANAARKHEYLAAIPPQARTTKEIAETLATARGRSNHSIEVAGPLEGDHADLPIDPYALGLWLGDGECSTAYIGMLPEDADAVIEACGTPLSTRINSRPRFDKFRLKGLQVALRDCGLLENKHIPEAYLSASVEQRLALLQGIMDTDGTVAKGSGACELSLSDERLFSDVFELICSLGIKATRREKPTKHKTAHITKFYSELPMFRLKRKLDLQNRTPKAEYVKRRYITAAERIEPQPVACIQVDNADHSYLAGRTFVTTHNSHLMRIAMIAWCLEIPKLQVYLFRRIFADLIANHMEGPSGFYNLLNPWVESGDCTIIEDEIRFSNGSKIHLCHCALEKHRFKYQGAEIHVLVVDELTLFTDKIYRFLRNRVRMTGIKLPPKYQGRFPRILCGSNPGNVGHLFVKKTFIEPAEPLKIWRTPKAEGGMLRQYIPARLDDNPSLKEADPNYEDRLAGLGSEALVKAFRDGNWDVIDGAFFDKWDEAKHVVRPFRIPAEWARFRSVDWGYAKPFSVGWWAIADGRYGDFPRGALIRYREWYGIKTDSEGQFEADVGLRLEADRVRDGIIQRSGGESYLYTVCDPAMWGTQTGQSPAETFYNEGEGILGLKKGNNTRIGGKDAIGGWDQMRGRLAGKECSDGVTRPMIYVFDTCRHSIRTIPALIHDEDRPEDLNSDMEDHAADEWRYACMSRPFIPQQKKRPPGQAPAGHVESNQIALPGVNDPVGWASQQVDLDR